MVGAAQRALLVRGLQLVTDEDVERLEEAEQRWLDSPRVRAIRGLIRRFQRDGSDGGDDWQGVTVVGIRRFAPATSTPLILEAGGVAGSKGRGGLKVGTVTFDARRRSLISGGSPRGFFCRSPT